MERIKKFNRELVEYKTESAFRSLAVFETECMIMLGEFEFYGTIQIGYDEKGEYDAGNYWQPPEYPEMLLYTMIEIPFKDIKDYNDLAKEEGFDTFYKLFEKTDEKDLKITISKNDFTVGDYNVIIDNEDIEDFMWNKGMMDLKSKTFYIL